MQVWRWTSYICLLLLPSVDAQKVGLKDELGFSCFNCALNWNFDCPAEVLPYDCRCFKDDFLTTAMNCVVEYGQDINEVVKGWKYIRDQCHYWGNRSMTIEDLQRTYLKNRQNLIDPASFNSTDTIAPGPVMVPADFINRQKVGAHDTKHHYNVGNYFAWTIVGYWGFIILGAIATNAIRVLYPNSYNLFGAGKTAWLRKYITLPALIGNNHHSPYRLFRHISIRAPTRGQSFVILGFVALNIASIVSFIEVEGDSPLAFTDTMDRKLHYLANRTGIISIGHVPILVLFACRNNPFQRLTGWPYDTFMLYHRWCARFMGTHAIIHTVAIYWSSIHEKVVLYKWHHVHNWRGGNLAIYMVILMLTLALRTIRSRIYEVFKVTHVMMFWIFIVCLVVHCSDYGWLGWLYTALAFYGIEYTCRMSAIMMSGGIHRAEIRLQDAEMYRIKIPGSKRKWDVKPGAYVYIRILDKELFWQSHPFSIFQGYESRSDDSLDLCCKAQLGSTRNILQKLISTPGKHITRNVIIEGPYGNENYVSDYDSILLYAGGVGFTAMYNYASHILKRLQRGQRLSLVWVVKDCAHLRAFENEIAHLARSSNEWCSLSVYVTRPEEMDLGKIVLTDTLDRNVTQTHDERATTQDDLLHLNLQASKETLVGTSGLDQNTNAEEMKTRRNSIDEPVDACKVLVDGDILLNIDYGRPDIAAGVSGFIHSASGTKAICSCGPPMFVDAIREGIVENIVGSEFRVDYFEDAFSW